MGTIRTKALDQTSSAMRRYQDVVVGSRSIAFLIWYELLITLLAPLPGALGIVLRAKLYRSLLGEVGRRLMIGRGVTLRHPRRIAIGQSVIVDDMCVLDGHSHADVMHSVCIGDETMIGRGTLINAKGGRIEIGSRTGIGAQCVMYAGESCVIHIGDDVLLAPFVYIGGTQYRHDRLDTPIAAQGSVPRGGVRIGNGAWIGAGVTLIDGVKIGEGSIVGAGAVVTRDVPDYTIVGGVPARVIGHRGGQQPVKSADVPIKAMVDV